MVQTELNFVQASSLQVVQLGDPNFQIEAKGTFAPKDAMGYVPNSESEQLRIGLPNFEGPLDLLLYLIQKHSMDIFDIPIAVITKEYLDALHEMEQLNLDVAGEFLVMASTLIQIKSKMLLPKEEQEIQPGEEEGADPRAELVRSLLEYQRYKEVAKQLEGRHLLGNDVFLRRFMEEPWMQALQNQESPIEAVDAFDMVQLFAAVMERAKPTVIHEVQREAISVRARMRELIDYSGWKLMFDLEEALVYFNAQTKSDMIVTFLSILEMVKLKLIKAYQPSRYTLRIEVISEHLLIPEEEWFQDRGNEE